MRRVLVLPLLVAQHARHLTVCRAWLATSQMPPQHRRSSTARAGSPNPNLTPPPGLPPNYGHPNVVLSSSPGASSERGRARCEDPDAVFLVTGCSRGLGLELATQLVQRTRGHIIATCRDPPSAPRLAALAAAAGPARLTVCPLDVTSQPTIDAAAALIASAHDGRLDGLYNVAGVLGDGGKTTPGPERALSAVDRTWAASQMAVNAMGPVMVAQAMAPFMRTTGRRGSGSGGSGGGSGGARPASVIVNFSARVGSISDNRLGGWWTYRMSKAALNQATKCLALELRRQGTWAFSYHPGTADTDLSKPFQANVRPEKLFPPSLSVSRALDIADCMDERHSGGFYDYSGQFVAW